MDAHRRPMIGFASIMNFLIALFLNQDSKSPFTYPPVSSVSENLKPVGKGVLEGVSDKSFSQFSSGESPFHWKNASLSWQRTAYHFQPKKNWMNDPNGPLFHMGWYHLFYQYNPDSPVWGNITWGHTISKDLIQWYHLPLAMVRDSSFDMNGVFTGSATLLPNGQIVMLYTGNIGSTNNPMQVQNLAYPANLSDPILLDWVKYEGNPVMVPPPEIGPGDFRDPATAWLAPDGTWRVTIGAKYKDNDTGIFLVYQTTNFTSYELLKGALHEVPNMGMWECVDFFPISTIGLNGLDTSTIGPGIKHVLKGGGINMHDYYSLGTYDWEDDRWTPDNPKEDLGFGFQVDYGTYYASKTFYDPQKQRRILWGWILEANSEDDDIKKGWASVQSIPRVVVFDNKTRTNILQWPVEEVESLRLNRIQFDGVVLRPGTVMPLNIDNATQLDITAEFEIDKEALEVTVEDNVSHDCSGGAIERGTLGPFGLLVIADQTLSEVTPIYFHIAKATDGNLKTFFCTDKTRSSKANGVDKQIYGAEVPVLEGENLSMRLLVDHSVVESFAQGGRTVITSRIYPAEAIYEAAQLFLFNNATGVNVTASLKIWQMKSLSFEDYKN